MSALFDYAVKFKETQTSVAVSLNFLHKLGVFVTPKAPAAAPSGGESKSSKSSKSELLAIEDKTAPQELAEESEFLESIEPQSIIVADYVMVEVFQDGYADLTDNADIAGFFDGGLDSIYLIFESASAPAGVTDPLNLDKFDTIFFTADFTPTAAMDMEFDEFKGYYIAVSSDQTECDTYQAIDKHSCFLDLIGSAYGACQATAYHLTRNYWRSNAYFKPVNPEKIGAIEDPNIGRTLLEKGISFFIKDEDQGTFLAFFGNSRVGIANHYIEREIKLKSQETLTNWTKIYEPLDTAIDLALAQKYANEPIAQYESEPYRYLDPEYDNRIIITSSDEAYKALGDFSIKIPNSIWVYDIESEVVTQ
ncbi:hypothetical protein P7245_22375 [Vibrio parahaemolyticus]|nr:hypothetical protein [Vibrio parahaemolyticus]